VSDKRFYAFMAGCAAAFLMAMVGAQAWYALPASARREVVPQGLLNLHPYQMVDERCSVHWKLRPGYSDGDITINEDGFKGSETPVRPFCVAVGDSCTFGLGGGWPEALQRRVGRPVVNGGVEGYSARNALCRLPDYIATGPEFAIVYIGWNDLFGEFPEPSRIGLVRLIETAGFHARQRWGHRTKRWEPQDDPQYAPSFLGDVEDIVVGFQDVGIRTLVVTLPGLYRTALRPSTAALEKGHLPVWTDNAYLLAYHTEVYNMALRDMCRDLGCGVIDAAAGFPYDEGDYMDSVHLTAVAQAKLGAWMAGRVR
jgi:hypothetical protein